MAIQSTDFLIALGFRRTQVNGTLKIAWRLRRAATIASVLESTNHSWMYTCSHHVIANSSYRRSGACLGGPEGMTIAPHRCFAQHYEAAIRDQFPAHWHVVG